MNITFDTNAPAPEQHQQSKPSQSLSSATLLLQIGILGPAHYSSLKQTQKVTFALIYIGVMLPLQI